VCVRVRERGRVQCLVQIDILQSESITNGGSDLLFQARVNLNHAHQQYETQRLRLSAQQLKNVILRIVAFKCLC
jgi:hypothetical protein